MTATAAGTLGVLTAVLVVQALLPGIRLLTVLVGALMAVGIAVVSGTSTAAAIFAGVPWDVLVIVVALGLLSHRVADTGLFARLSVAAVRLSAGSPTRLWLIFAVCMYLVSGLINNLTALLLVLPVLLGPMAAMGVDRRYVASALGATLVACNLGGAATPIGDFPAILLMGRGAMDFTDYATTMVPRTALTLLVFGGLVLLRRPARGLVVSPLSRRLAVRTTEALHRGIRIDRRALFPALGALIAMLVAWVLVPRSSGIGPELIAWAGAAVALVSAPTTGESLLRRHVDVEALLFLLGLFLIVGAVRASGAFDVAAAWLIALPVSPDVQLVLFLLLAGLLTGLFSAGPGMAALLDVGERLAEQHPPAVVYTGLAMAVCAGSSLFLTAATAGPLAQMLTDRAELVDADGLAVRFGFSDYLPVGLLGFLVTLGAAIVFTLASA
ncbi:permease [Myxococcota bacterium]|nr:permease [Myxococcota bacterium]